MPNQAKPTPDETPATSTFASRKAERDAREAAGEQPPTGRTRTSLRAGHDAESPVFVVRHVQG